MNIKLHKPKLGRGFAILEALLAVAVCGIMATGIVVAMKSVTRLSFEAKREAALTRIIYNKLMFETTKPRLQEGFTSERVDEWDVDIETEISPIEDLVDQEGNVVAGLLKVNVRAVWWGDGDYESIDASTWRNPQMYAN